MLEICLCCKQGRIAHGIERNEKYKRKEEKFINTKRRLTENAILKFLINVKDFIF